MSVPLRRALVAGGAGFLGTQLVKALLERETEVWVLDNGQTGSWDNLVPLRRQYGCQLQTIVHDITLPLPVAELPEDFSHVANLACAASPPRYQVNPVHTLLTSVNGTHHLLQLARAQEAVFFQASTSEVYGDPQVHPQPESDWGHVNPIGPRACYDEGKRAAETLCMDFHRQYDSRVKVARIFNTYGPGMAIDDGRVVTQLIGQALAGRPLTLYGTGEQTRSLCYVDDLINGILQLWLETPDTVIGPVNLGNDREITMLDLAHFIQTLVTPASPLIFEPLPTDDPRQRRPDLSLARQVLNGWEPQVHWQEGVRRTFEHFRTKQAIPSLGE